MLCNVQANTHTQIHASLTNTCTHEYHIHRCKCVCVWESERKKERCTILILTFSLYLSNCFLLFVLVSVLHWNGMEWNEHIELMFFQHSNTITNTVDKRLNRLTTHTQSDTHWILNACFLFTYIHIETVCVERCSSCIWMSMYLCYKSLFVQTLFAFRGVYVIVCMCFSVRFSYIRPQRLCTM